MIYLELFLTFFKIGLFTIGGGYAMIPLVREEALNFGLTESEIMNFIAVSESTPGPIAVNMATFVGSSQGGILGSAVATLGVVLPSFIIILLISALLKNLLKYAGVNAALSGVRPVVAGLILATSITMFLSVVLGLGTIADGVSFDWRAAVILGMVWATSFGYKKWKKKAVSPILLIVTSGVLGVVFYELLK